jgi:D-glycero-D-manno-heptose 1,7-bisphosphate phosphatase
VTSYVDRFRAAVFLDRDGVLNEAMVRNGRPVPPSKISEFVLLGGVVEACQRLRRSGFALVVVTNQPDVARGTQSMAEVEAMNHLLRSEIDLDAIFVCPHSDEALCECRKPAPGMLLAGAKELGVDLGESFMVGDRWRDIEAGRRAGCRTIHIDRNYDEEVPYRPDAVVGDLPSAVDWIEATLIDAKETRSA